MKRRLIDVKRRDLMTLLANAPVVCFTKNSVNPHTTDHIDEYGQKGDIDVALVPLVRQLWRLKFITTGSCESQPEDYSFPGQAYVGMYEPDAQRFMELLKNSDIKYTCEPALPIKGTINGIDKEFRSSNIHFAPDDIDKITERISKEK